MAEKRKDDATQQSVHFDTARLFGVLCVFTLAVFLLVGTTLFIFERLSGDSAAVVKGLAPAVSSELFADMLGMELSGFTVEHDKPHMLSSGHVLSYMAQLLTSVNPRDPKSLIAGEIPGIRDEAVQLRRGLAADGDLVGPADYAPPVRQTNPPLPQEMQDIADKSRAEEQPDGQSQDQGGPPQPSAPTDPQPGSGAASAGSKTVFIYHSHNRESWVPELAHKGVKELNAANDAEINITLVGKRLAEQLEKLGIGAQHSGIDYKTEVANHNWNFSYKYSQQTVKAAMSANDELDYFFDIHRDSQRRDLTTVDIGGKSYAQVFFVIGMRNPDWKKNEAFATSIHEALERQYPGLSRGIWGKDANAGNGEYNQSLSPNNILVEIGGPENTLAESERTADVLAEVIADIIRGAEKVNTGE